jgi:MYXO-CTERM domain-containing protein
VKLKALVSGLGFCSAVAWSNSAFALQAGGIAFTHYEATDPDTFAFVTLAPISTGEQIKFTDNGWLNTGALRTAEGTITWTATSDLLVGTEIVVSSGVVTHGSVSISGSFLLSTSGDQIIAYQGDASSPVLITAIQMNGAWDANAMDTATSALPTGLVDGDTALAIVPEVDNAAYPCTQTTVGTAAELRSALHSPSLWLTSNASLPASGCTFVVLVPCNADAGACSVDAGPQTDAATPTDAGYSFDASEPFDAGSSSDGAASGGQSSTHPDGSLTEEPSDASLPAEPGLPDGGTGAHGGAPSSGGGAPSTNPPDANATEAGSPGINEAGSNASVHDASLTDHDADATAPSANDTDTSAGCSCSIPNRSHNWAPTWVLALVATAAWRRRRASNPTLVGLNRSIARS